MADQKKNEVAEALAAMARGAVPSEGETPSGGIPSETTVFGSPQGRPASDERSTDGPPALPRSQIQPSSQSQSPATFPQPVTAEDPGQPRRPARPSGPRTSIPKNAPLPSAIAPQKRIAPSDLDEGPARVRPARPERRTEAPAPPMGVEEEQPAGTLAEIIEDDETIAAAPDASAFAPRISRKPAQARLFANLSFRRTIIPILLTCGLMLPTIGLWSMFDPDAPLAAVGRGVEVLLIVVGAILFILGILNAFHVRHILAMAAKRQSD